MPLYLSNQHRIQVSVSGVTFPPSLVWDTLEGGDIAAANEYYHPGNMGPATPAGGLRTPTDLTCTIAWSDTMYGLYVPLWNAAGFTSASVSLTPLNPDKSVSVKPTTWSGLLISVTRPHAEAASSTIGYLQCVVAPAESITQN